MSDKSRISKNGSSFDQWKGPIHDPYEIIDHFIDEPKGRSYEKPWLEFISNLNGLARASVFNLCAIFYRKSQLCKFKMINYETFEVKKNPKFQQKLKDIADQAETLQIIHGMKPIPKEWGEKYDEFKGKEYINCVIFVARDAQGKIIQTI